MASSREEQVTSNQHEPDTLVIEDQSLLHGFIQLPKQVLYARNLSRDAKLLYGILLSYAWQEDRCFPGYGRLCDDMQGSENMVRKYMRELEAVGLIKQKRRGLGKTNIYVLCDLRTSKIEVLEHQKSKVLKPQFSNDKVETSKDKQIYKETDLSRGQSPQNSQERKGSSYSHSPMATGNQRKSKEETYENNVRVHRAKPSALGDVMQARLQNFEVQAATSSPPRQQGTKVEGKPRGHWKAAPIFIQAIIADWYGLEMNDQALHSSITRANRLYQYFTSRCTEAHPEMTFEEREDVFRQVLQKAREKAKRRTPKVWTTPTKQYPNGKPNRMPLFFACLEELLGMKKEKGEASPPN